MYSSLFIIPLIGNKGPGPLNGKQAENIFLSGCLVRCSTWMEIGVSPLERRTYCMGSLTLDFRHAFKRIWLCANRLLSCSSLPWPILSVSWSLHESATALMVSLHDGLLPADDAWSYSHQVSGPWSWTSRWRLLLVFLGSFLFCCTTKLSVLLSVMCFRPHLPFLLGDNDPDSANSFRIRETWPNPSVPRRVQLLSRTVLRV